MMMTTTTTTTNPVVVVDQSRQMNEEQPTHVTHDPTNTHVNDMDSSIDTVKIEWSRMANTSPPPTMSVANDDDDNNKYEVAIHPKLKKILKTYRNQSQRNILGPQLSPPNTTEIRPSPAVLTSSVHVTRHELDHHQTSSAKQQAKFDYDDLDNWSAPPPNSHIKHNVDTLHQTQSLLANTNKYDTYLHGERITCFIVGGEKRLCLPEMLNYVLKDFTVQQINSVCEKLRIYCSRCTNDQLDTLKSNRLLPLSAPSCGLITLSDAERLCHMLFGTALGKTKKLNDATNTTLGSSSTSTSILKVYHRCFGRTYGIIHTQLYTNANSQCIECDTCHLLYTPQNFVVHTHKHDETRICHWGFSSANWRFYLQLINSYKDSEKHRIEFEEFKSKFATSNKRKMMNTDEDREKIQNSTTNNENINAYSKSSPNKLGLAVNQTTSYQTNSEQSNKKLNSAIDIKDLYMVNNSSDQHKLLNDMLTKPMSDAFFSSQPQQQQQHLVTQNLSSKQLSSYLDNHGEQFIKNFCKYSSDQIETINGSIRYEIEMNVKSMNSKERLIAYMQQLHDAYDEKLQKSNNKIQFEMQEMKQGLTTENETLKNRLKMCEIENQLLRNQLNKIQQQMIVYNELNHRSQPYDTIPSSNTERNIISDMNIMGISTNCSSSSTSPQQQAAIALISLNSPNSNPTSPPPSMSAKFGSSPFRKPSLGHLQYKANKLMLMQSPNMASGSGFLKCETIS